MWSKQLLLKFEPLKTKAVLFNTRKNLYSPYLTFKDCTLDLTSKHKHPGIIFSHHHRWTAYIDSTLSNAYKKLKYGMGAQIFCGQFIS